MDLSSTLHAKSTMPATHPGNACLHITLKADTGSSDAMDRHLVLTDQERMPVGRASVSGGKDLKSKTNNMFLTSPIISRKHAELYATWDEKFGGRLFVEDLNSSHGTFVNKHKITPGTSCQLASGDSVRFGIDISRDLDSFKPPEYKISISRSDPTPPTDAETTPGRSFQVPFDLTDDESDAEASDSEGCLSEDCESEDYDEDEDDEEKDNEDELDPFDEDYDALVSYAAAQSEGMGGTDMMAVPEAAPDDEHHTFQCMSGEWECPFPPITDEAAAVEPSPFPPPLRDLSPLWDAPKVVEPVQSQTQIKVLSATPIWAKSREEAHPVRQAFVNLAALSNAAKAVAEKPAPAPTATAAEPTKPVLNVSQSLPALKAKLTNFHNETRKAIEATKEAAKQAKETKEAEEPAKPEESTVAPAAPTNNKRKFDETSSGTVDIPVKSDVQRPIKKARSSSYRVMAAVATAGALVGSIGTLGLLASLPAGFFD